MVACSFARSSRRNRPSPHYAALGLLDYGLGLHWPPLLDPHPSRAAGLQRLPSLSARPSAKSLIRDPGNKRFTTVGTDRLLKITKHSRLSFFSFVGVWLSTCPPPIYGDSGCNFHVPHVEIVPRTASQTAFLLAKTVQQGRYRGANKLQIGVDFFIAAAANIWRTIAARPPQRGTRRKRRGRDREEPALRRCKRFTPCTKLMLRRNYPVNCLQRSSQHLRQVDLERLHKLLLRSDACIFPRAQERLQRRVLLFRLAQLRDRRVRNPGD